MKYLISIILSFCCLFSFGADALIVECLDNQEIEIVIGNDTIYTMFCGVQITDASNGNVRYVRSPVNIISQNKICESGEGMLVSESREALSGFCVQNYDIEFSSIKYMGGSAYPNGVSGNELAEFLKSCDCTGECTFLECENETGCIEGDTIELSECSDGKQNQTIITTELNGDECVTSEVTNVLPCSPNPCETICIDVLGSDNNQNEINGNSGGYNVITDNGGWLNGFFDPRIGVDVVVDFCGETCDFRIEGVDTPTPAQEIFGWSETVASLVGGVFGNNDYGLYPNHYASAFYIYTDCDECDNVTIIFTADNGTIFESAFDVMEVEVCASDAPELTVFSEIDCQASACCPELRNVDNVTITEINENEYCNFSVFVTDCNGEGVTGSITQGETSIELEENGLIPSGLTGSWSIAIEGCEVFKFALPECGGGEMIVDGLVVTNSTFTSPLQCIWNPLCLGGTTFSYDIVHSGGTTTIVNGVNGVTISFDCSASGFDLGALGIDINTITSINRTCT